MALSVVTAFALALPWTAPSQAASDTATGIATFLASDDSFEKLSSSAPSIPTPDWYNNVTIYYTVAKNGNVSDLETFARLADETLNDDRGWARMGVRFERVSSGGTLQLILAEAAKLPTYSSGCTADWSCNVGNLVIINDTRWTQASPSWNAAGGTLRDYRHMVVNHETGHWLGHGHAFCGGTGNIAPVMQQQSIDLMGCKFNPWPTTSELWTSRF